MTALLPAGQAILRELVNHINGGEVIPNRPDTFLGYQQVHENLRLPYLGPTIGESLKRQGLAVLAEWTKQNNHPAITGLIVDQQSLTPGNGYFELFDKDIPDFRWWENEIRRSLGYDWQPYLGENSPPLPTGPAGSTSAEQQRLVTTLEVVTTESQIRENVRRFVRDMHADKHRSQKLIRQTTYWVFDEDEDQFGPSKFVGYREMTFGRYERALAGHSAGASFDGGTTREAIEAVAGGYGKDEQLTERLQDWCVSQLGNSSLEGIDVSKWEFVSMKSARRYWAFLCVPEKYDGLAAAKVLDEIVWNVDRGDPKQGDRVIVWQAKGGGRRRGVVALGEVISEEVATLRSPPQERPFWRTEEFGPKPSIRFRVIRAPGIPIWEGEGTEWLGDLAVARARGGTVFSLEPSQWHRLAKAADATEIITTDSVIQRLKSQGFMADPRARKAVEIHAQSLAETHFVELGYEVRDVHKFQSYDLHCLKSDEELFVESKGTTGDGDAVFLTRNEVDFARRNKNRMALAVVRRIQVIEEVGNIVARGGELTVTFPWDVDQGVLSPLLFEYRFSE